MSKDKLLAELKAILKKAHIEPTSKYLTAKQIEKQYGFSEKNILNRSNLPRSHKRFIPSVRLKGGRLKYFERKVVERMIEFGRADQ